MPIVKQIRNVAATSLGSGRSRAEIQTELTVPRAVAHSENAPENRAPWHSAGPVNEKPRQAPDLSLRFDGGSYVSRVQKPRSVACHTRSTRRFPAEGLCTIRSQFPLKLLSEPLRGAVAPCRDQAVSNARLLRVRKDDFRRPATSPRPIERLEDPTLSCEPLLPRDNTASSSMFST